MYRNGLLMTVIVVVCMSVGLAFAADGGNSKKGKYLWKTNCKTCHVEGGGAAVLSPSSKTVKEWTEFFDNNTKPVIMEKCKKFPEGNLKDIRTYMLEHAKDSDQPETCG
jgi:hypothetical protein